MLHPIPSVIDLPSQVGVRVDMDEGVSASTVKDRLGEVEVKLRSVSGAYGSNKFPGNVRAKMYVKDEEAKAAPVKHYDVDGS